MKRLLAAYVFICFSLLAAWQASAQLVGDGVFKPPGTPIITPSNIFGPNLIAWFTADQGVINAIQTQTPATNGQSVAQWNDITGNGNSLFQVTTAHQPVFGTAAFNSKPGLTFTAANSNFMASSPFNLTPAFSGLQAASVWIVGFYTSSCQAFCRWYTSSDGNTSNTSDVSQGDNISFLQENNLAQSLVPSQGTAGFVPAFNLNFNVKARLGVVLTSTQISAYLNSSLQGTGVTTGSGFSSTICMALGASVKNNCVDIGSHFDGVIAEAFFTNIAPSFQQIQLIDRYLKNHWGL